MAGRSDLEAVQNFIVNTGVEAITHTYDDDGSIWAEYGVTGQPAFAFIDAAGNVEVQYGRMGEEGLAERLDAIL